jgi:hypothetical protein
VNAAPAVSDPVADAPTEAITPPAPFPWAGSATSASTDPATDAADSSDAGSPFTPLDNELWEVAPLGPGAIVAEPTPAAVNHDEPAAPSVVAESYEPQPTLAVPANPFADSRWVELDQVPELQPTPVTRPISSSATDDSSASGSVFGIAPLPETQYGAPEIEGQRPAEGLIAPRGIPAFATVDDGSELAPPPMMQEGGPTNSEFLARIKPISEIVPYFQPDPMPVPNDLPTSPTDRGFVPTEFAWSASNVYHNPLYFEDFALERYGHTHHPVVQPFVSIGKFTGQFIGLPYKMAIDPVWDEEYVLGWYRPGELAPHLFYQVPWNWRAAATAAGTYTGLIFLFP